VSCPNEFYLLHFVELSGDTLTTTTIHWSFRRQGSPEYVEATVAEQVDIPGRCRKLFALSPDTGKCKSILFVKIVVFTFY